MARTTKVTLVFLVMFIGVVIYRSRITPYRTLLRSSYLLRADQEADIHRGPTDAVEIAQSLEKETEPTCDDVRRPMNSGMP
jgi:hypothetical protein